MVHMYVMSFFFVTDPTLTATITPSSYSGLDVDPFNTFSLMCTARKPSSITPALGLTWYHNEMQLDNSVAGISILEEEVSGGAERSSTLTVTSAHTISSGVYTCISSVGIPESNTVTSNQSAAVTIRGMYASFTGLCYQHEVISASHVYCKTLFPVGPSAPTAPTILGSTVSTTQVTINWIVTVIAYTPESYFIVYGLSNDTLNLRSDAVEGVTNLTATNLAYSATITGLRPFTRYYYRIDVRNSFTTTESTIQNFQTTEAGNCKFSTNPCTCCLQHACLYTAPTLPPDSFSIVSIGSRNVTLSWTLPDEDGRNGMITSYTVTCSDSNGVLVNTLTTVDLSATFEDLSPYSFYTCSIFATTSGGDGPATTLNFTTASDSKFMRCVDNHGGDDNILHLQYQKILQLMSKW